MNEQDWNQLILQYLKQRGFAEAEQALSKALQANGAAAKDEMALAHRLETHKGVVESLVTHFASEGEPQFYVEAFERLANWVYNSLDLYRAELSRVVYPCFLHTYLELVSRDATAAASTFLHKHRKAMADDLGGGGSQSARSQQLLELQGLVGSQQLDSHRLAKQLKGARHTAHMSAYSHDLLLHFLHTTPRMLPVANIVSQHIIFEVGEAWPGGAEEEGAGQEGDDAAAEDAEAVATNQTQVQLNLLKGNIEDLCEEEKTKALNPAPAAAAGGAGAGAGEDGEGGGAAGEGGTGQGGDDKGAGEGQGGAGAAGSEAAAAAPAPKKSRKEKEREKAAAAEAAAAKKERPERIDPLPHVAPLSEAVTQVWLADLDARCAVSASTLPSCCFFTFVNTKQTLTCASFSADALRVAAGFADSSIRLYDVQQLSRPRSYRQGAAMTPGADAATPGGSGVGGDPMDTDDDPDDMEGPSLRTVGGGQGGLPPPSVHLCGHTAPVYALDFGHDMRLMASGSGDGSIRLWSPELGASLAALKGHTLPVWDVSHCPHGWLLASASADRTARIWATDMTRPIRILAGHQSDVSVVRWHPNCHYVATASSDRSVRLWDVAGGECVRVLGGLRNGSPTSLAMSPDGKQAACGTDDGCIHVWDLGSAKKLVTLQGHVGPIWSLAYSCGSGSLLVSGGADETVRLWSNETAGDVMPASAGPSGTADAAAAASGAGAGGAGAGTAGVTGVAAVGRGGRDPPGVCPSSSSAPALYCPVKAYRTKSSPVVALRFTNRNLLLGAGAFTLRQGGRGP